MGRLGTLRRLRGTALALLLCVAPAAGPSAEAGDDVPLPLTGKITVKANGKRFVVDGKQVIPSGSLIKLDEAVHVVGVHDASLEVKGGLRALGGDDGKVTFDGIDFSPTVAPENGFHLNDVDVKNGKFVHSEGTAFCGEMTIENVQWDGAFDVRIVSGFVRIMSTSLGQAATITCVPEKGRPPEVAIRGGKVPSLVLRGPCAGTLRNAEVGTFEAVGFTDLLVDACDVSGGLTFTQPAEGSFARLGLTKCNLLAGATLTFRRPSGPKTTVEKVRIDKFWFGRADGKADLDDKAIGARIHDGADDPEVTVRAYWQYPQERKR